MTQFVTRAECDAALPDTLAAPKDDAPIDTLCFRTGYGERSFPEAIKLSSAQGIEGERWAVDPWLTLADGSPDPRIQVCILSKRVLDLCWRDPATVHPGDTIIADLDLSEANMPVGARLQIGGAVIEVSDVFNTACAKWKKRYGVDSVRWINDPAHRALRLRGILCRVTVDGEIRATDRIRKLT